jgi:flagellar basal-body rod protein FlgB
MLNRMMSTLDFQGQALSLRAERQAILGSNIANADTPGYKARDIDFAKALAQATGATSSMGGNGQKLALAAPSSGGSVGHLPVGGGAVAGATERSTLELAYRTPDQASMDGNTVELDQERANFADNAVRFEATLRFINGDVRTMLSAIKGE